MSSESSEQEETLPQSAALVFELEVNDPRVQKLLKEHERSQMMINLLQTSLGAALIAAPNRKITIISDKTERSKRFMNLIQTAVGGLFSVLPPSLVTAGDRQRKIKRSLIQGKRIVWADVGDSKLDFNTLKSISDKTSFLPVSSSLFITSSSDDFGYLSPRLDGEIIIIRFD
jgi:hypothetical protein